MPSDRHTLRVHVVPPKVLVAVWAVLLVLTWLTVTVTKIELGNANIVAALAIAVVKSSFVALYFMHLRYDRPFHALVFVIAVLFMFLFITFALLDTKAYQPDLIRSYGIDVGERAGGA